MSTVYPHITTSADLLKSIVRLDDLFPFLAEQKTESAAVVNSSLYGVLPFFEAAEQKGIKPVLGLSAMFEWPEGSCRTVLYAKDDDGYRNLLKLSSALGTTGKETVPGKWAAAYRKGICCAILFDSGWNPSGGEEIIRSLKEIYGRDLRGAVTRPGGKVLPEESFFSGLCQAEDVPVMATQVCRYFREADESAYEAATAIRLGRKLAEEDWARPVPGQHVPDAAEFQDWFSDRPEWLEETERLMASCHVSIPRNQQFLPVFPLPEGVSADSHLRQRCLQGLKDRNCIGKDYEERLSYELSVISDMGYSDYFLIVADFIGFARDKGIMTGPGRGSSAGSLVAYALRITDVDPIRHGLLFERFLNPERVTMPDIDVDFADYRRQEVIDYVAKKYGSRHTAQIITYGTLSAKAVARDTARVFGFSAEDLEAVSRMIPSRPGITLDEVHAESVPFRDWVAGDRLREDWYRIAKTLEGLPRNASTHAAGVILSPIPLVDIVPVEQGNEGIFMTQWPMNDLEKTGLLKMDFLGLRNLTILERISRLVKQSEGRRLDFRQVPLDDEGTFRLLAAGDTAGVFQLESEGMQRALRLIRPTAFRDIVAVNALYRPGPMDFIPVYAKRKKGEEQVRYLHPALEPILEETYGVITYQEQIMRIASVMAGFSLGEADLLRRAVSKKNRDILDREREHFVSGALGKGYDRKTADAVYDLIVRFADYGFPKSHAVAYSLISYWLAFAKAHVPAHFYAALLSAATGSPDKVRQLIQEAKAKGIRMLPPSVQSSSGSFTVEGEGLRFGLSAVKGVPGSTVRALLGARTHGPFTSLFDVAERISAVHFKEKNVRPLILAGAFDDFGKDRAILLASLEAAEKHAELIRPTEEPGLFDGLGDSFMKPKYTAAGPMPEKEKLAFEKEALGFYLSDHPVELEKRSRSSRFLPLNEIANCRERAAVTVLGTVKEVKRIRTKKGDAMAFVTLEDETGTASATLFPGEFAKYGSQLEGQEIIELEGAVEFRNRRPSIICRAIKS
ncbi:DNA polymerase III subunit alpha [Indiicoccus explosivorum]|uniref:DNA polymerase III subunit alpha n=1 Tax=Indiicoccus explosivorum TaxID=1917864 RepID=UPI000B446EAF|nr:DNA polymerase III subunit alpha [Indiicoccus explosivorum]